MAIRVLVADPNPAFAAMIQQVLEETERFKVTIASTGAEAIGESTRDSFDMAILESSLEDFSLRDAVTVLRRNQPYLPIMVILPFGEQALPDAAKYFDVQGMLSKPLYIPDLHKQIELALTKPVNGIFPPPRSFDQLLPNEPHPSGAAAPTAQTQQPDRPASRYASGEGTTQPLKRSAPPAPAWLADVSHAAQYLTTLTLESSAEAALLMRGQQLIAFAGQCSKADADELTRVVATQWAKDGGGGQGAQVRFIRLTSGADYLVYSTLAAEDVVLSMAFQAETPLGQIRKQAKRATQAMMKAPAIETATAQTAEALAEASRRPPAASSEAEISGPILEQVLLDQLAPKAEPQTAEPPVTEEAEPLPADLGLQSTPPFLIDDAPPQIDWAAVPTEPETRPTTPGPIPDWASAAPTPASVAPDLSSLFTPADESNRKSQAVFEDEVEPIPDEAALNELSNKILKLERQALVEGPPPLDLAPFPLHNIRRTAHSLFDLSYTFLLIPRLPNTALTGDIKDRLEHWLAALADAYEWQAGSIRLEPDHLEISLACPPADAPEKVARVLMQETTDKIFAEFPRLAADHAKRPGAFWSSAYYVVAPARRLSPEEIDAFVEYQRREQSGGKL